ncbi:hypothetical protein ATCC90586_009671 [Pythium insidiosum]|nr:hypothetical protein ATCC90586_009671 [Pythium insidiosum]
MGSRPAWENKGAQSAYRRALRGGGGGGGSAWARSSQGARAHAASVRSGRGMTESKLYALRQGDALDRKFGFPLLRDVLEAREDAEDGDPEAPRLGWLLNMRACSLPDAVDGKHEVSAIELYFLEQDGRAFKTRVVYQPYFYVRAEDSRSQEVIAYCQRRFEGLLAKAERVLRDDLDLPNHLSGRKAVYVKLSCFTVGDLVTIRQALAPIVEKNQQQRRSREAYHQKTAPDQSALQDDDVLAAAINSTATGDESESALLELREYDVPYPMRVAIDLDIRVGAWYHVRYDPTAPYQPSDIERLPDLVDKAEPVVCAFDIETTKAPLKFPDATIDQVYMISYMIDRQGYLIVNREFVSEDIADFEYTPKEDYPGPFIVFNERDEEALLRRFLEHLAEVQPHIYVTYNGDFFDWPFLDARYNHHGINLGHELGVTLDQRSGEYRGRSSVHLDAFCWVKRDSYLPQGSQGLKAVTKYKLGYDPVEVDAEDMVALARDDPHRMASYSVSDAVATFYLYDKYVHLFVFSLCTIIPLNCEDVLRKGSGTLCEALLMVEAFQNNIICPNKSTSGPENNELFHHGHLVESETYVGGHVECLESGVFRADFAYDFNLVPSAFQHLQDHLDRDLRFAIEVEMELSMDEIANYDDVKQAIYDELQALKDKPVRREKPLIYHLDVGAMYPNIILTNRLQPCAIVTEADCAACVYNTECGRSALQRKKKTEEEIGASSCQRVMDWVWRGDYYPASRAEYMAIKTQLEYENFPANSGKVDDPVPGKSNEVVPFRELKADRQRQLAKTRLKHYCSSVYKKLKVTSEEKRSATVCMRENSFYVDTVRAFRDRRYDYKTLTKVWKGKQSQAEKNGDLLGKIEAGTKALVYDSLQLAHKCILNSFYGYVMRKGARWHSMEMAGIVTHTGSRIITNARKLVEQIGRPLELDTDGIWAIFPASFPENFTFMLKDGKTKKRISYPCVMLNAQVQNEFNNPQYHELDPASGTFRVKKECSILFEVDGPYKAMVLPASTEEGKLLKKRYAVFNFDHSLAELKGFELKRRGELQLIKAFQSQVFECFLDGATLEECYASVARCANRWLDVIDTRARNMHDEELLALLTENKSMSGKLDEYEGQKSTSITTAKRLSEFLGAEMIKDKGLTCQMIIACKPIGEKVTERAIPTAIFSTEEAVKRHFLRKWLKDPNMQDFDIRTILDWEYYRGDSQLLHRITLRIPRVFYIELAEHVIQDGMLSSLENYLPSNGICVDLELDGLAVNALLVATQLDSIEGISTHQVSLDFDEGKVAGNQDGGSSTRQDDGDTDRCEEAFRLLRAMVTNLFKDFVASRNKFADHLLQQFYRWLCSPHALCYDPALLARVKQLMEKVFLQLLAELRRLGAQIIFADLSKIVLCTRKDDLENAQTYVTFILQTVLRKELFQVLSLTPRKYYAHLFFLDAENYGAVMLKDMSKDANEDEEDEDAGEKGLEIISHWNIANHLPRGIDDYFLLLVGQFIRRRAEFHQRALQKASNGAKIEDDAEAMEQAQLAEEDQEKELSPLAKYSQRLVATYFSDKLLRIVPEIVTYNLGRESFPIHSGSHLAMESPALELVKFVCAVFQLERTVDTAVQKLKRTLLKLLQVSEFSETAQFRNPSLAFLVPDVICQSCNLCRSVDLCRDPQLFKIQSEDDTSATETQNDEDAQAAQATWHCPRCFALYDKTMLEARLVEMVQGLSVQFQLQDLYCSKCLLPAEWKMREYCTCSGSYCLSTGSRERLNETLRLLHRVAEQHDFAWLLETVQRLEVGM